MCKALEELMADVILEREKAAASAARKKANQKAAINLFNNNISIEVIADSFNQSIETIKEWIAYEKV